MILVGKPARWYKDESSYPTNPGFKNVVNEVQFVTGKNGFIFRNDNPNFNEVEMDQILSTFMFLGQASDSNQKTYTSQEVVDYYSPYIISYPSDWTIVEKKLTNPDGLMVTFTSKNSSSIMIGQYAGDGGRCLYTTDTDYSTYQGAGKQFLSYSQLQVSPPAKWRLSVPNLTDKFTHTVCEEASGPYIDTTRIGSIQINLKSGDSLEDIQKILESVQFKPTSNTKTLFN